MKTSPIQTAVDRITDALKEAKSPDDIAVLTDRLLAAVAKLEEGKERLWTTDDAANFLRLKPDTVRRYAAAEMLPHVRINSTTLFIPERLKRWALSQEKQMNKVWR